MLSNNRYMDYLYTKFVDCISYVGLSAVYDVYQAAYYSRVFCINVTEDGPVGSK